jgi:type IV pilus assembly protein PilC
MVIVALGGIGYGIKSYYGTPSGRRLIDAVLLKTPILGGVLRKVAVARFCRTLSTLLASGVPILDGLDITARTAGNAIIEEAILTTRTSIERGETISAPLRETNVFPSMVVQMINVGETTGALDAMLSKIADFYEEEVDTAVAGLLTLMEPVMIAFLGVVVGGIVIAMYMPIFDLISKMT